MRLAQAERFFAALEAIGAQPVFEFAPEDVPADFRRAAVLLLFVEAAEGEVAVVVTKRAADLSTHSGEMCFPGGRLEAGETAIDAALREAEEEIGLDRGAVTVHGRLDDAWAFGGFVLVPVIASARAPIAFVPKPSEVEAVLLESLDGLLDPARFEVEHLEYRGVSYENPKLPLSTGETLFGLSADLLLEVRDRLERGCSERGSARLEELRMTVKARAFER